MFTSRQQLFCVVKIFFSTWNDIRQRYKEKSGKITKNMKKYESKTKYNILIHPLYNTFVDIY